ncbi:5-oxoprolinase [Sphingobacterium lactis]|uniref:5-oxoprolinase n=1 Tax=Sphingobacterium kyonggiense TaxID=714075 RepID=A0ABP7YRV8_9SPHI
MSHTKDFQQHLVEQFHHYSTQELVILNNELVRSNWGSSKTAFRNALLSTLSNRGIDLSAIIHSLDGFTQIQRIAVRLEANKLVPLD